ncbi:CHAP domain-containing protein [Staphylococcus edaphicus]|uniref:CHAP domain-containing protein n=1 Tax=Staphylococcus edaphicus TaxID=1955013 RepID=A0A2C6VEZ7_9STAP|nr:CHAP domain-containing protein [Staphylococcus edaphicus]PHK48891.1 peptidase M23 [Staphylococcus edaphicus]UQW81882.1 CHAP domain-containing protein [Staphylococcus edaphicus]
MTIKKKLVNVFIATTVLMTGTVTFQSINETKTTDAAVNYYNKNQCTWYVFKKRASVGKPVPNGWGNAKYWYSKAKNAGYRVGKKPAKRAVMQSTSGAYGHVAYVETVYNNGSIKVSEYNYNRPLAYGTRVLSKATAAKHHYIY